VRREDHERLVHEAAAMQRQIAAQRPGEAVIHKGFALKAEIHPAIYAHWRMRYGKGFWKHDLDWFLKKNPECRVKQRAEKPTILVPSLGGIAPSRPVTGRRGRWAL
jgi:hypothetical protein